VEGTSKATLYNDVKASVGDASDERRRSGDAGGRLISSILIGSDGGLWFANLTELKVYSGLM
jgi:hypothetical protein